MREAAGRAPEQDAAAEEQVVESDLPAEDAEREEQRRTAGTILSIEDLVGARVVTGSGMSRGTVVDVTASPPPELRIRGLIVGRWSWLERLRVAVRLRHRLPQAARLQEIPWSAVDRWDGLRIVLRDDPEIREIELAPGPTGQLQPGSAVEPVEPESVADDRTDGLQAPPADRGRRHAAGPGTR